VIGTVVILALAALALWVLSTVLDQLPRPVPDRGKSRPGLENSLHLDRPANSTFFVKNSFALNLSNF
jgi:hypothetical protein